MVRFCWGDYNTAWSRKFFLILNVKVPMAFRLPVVSEPEMPEGTSVSATGRLPRWLKRPIPKSNSNHLTDQLMDELGLETVCENAKCPNRMECYSQQTATFMILGNVCTRPCGFCAVNRGRPPQAPAEDEPARVAEAAARLGLKHVVITSVTRDDLPDGGADHFYRCVIAVRERTGATTEVLTPDFVQCKDALGRVIEARPDVFNHNMETVPRLYRRVRGPKSDYAWTLQMMREVKKYDATVKTKSGLMLGMGEERGELLDALADLREYGVDFLTLGQYLQPGEKYLPVVRYVPPEEFDEIAELAKEMGFLKVASGPFVRSSYHARDMAETA
ncbi:Lipoyl synthase [Allorhodopirellula heiligendammensis]|uniref:Lipoyl synthase n=2 Tax=Allorhodopirellula heiligendammensis TaxID=2714739 RepID=A0A5C6BG87_9BACT|nr:Lipoyl synthase [Allorhodopirellula heiligendammensis]